MDRKDVYFCLLFLVDRRFAIVHLIITLFVFRLFVNLFICLYQRIHS